jgi:hypothetical protein
MLSTPAATTSLIACAPCACAATGMPRRRASSTPIRKYASEYWGS